MTANRRKWSQVHLSTTILALTASVLLFANFTDRLSKRETFPGYTFSERGWPLTCTARVINKPILPADPDLLASSEERTKEDFNARRWKRRWEAGYLNYQAHYYALSVYETWHLRCAANLAIAISILLLCAVLLERCVPRWRPQPEDTLKSYSGVDDSTRKRRPQQAQ